MKIKRNGFTLIELITVLVIMAIIALIVTPLVMSIIKKAKISARKRSVDAYGRSVELAIASYLLDTGTFPTDLHSLTIEYSGNTVVCNVMQMKENGGLYMSECSVNNVEVKDNSTEDGWYHYGTRDLTNEEYVDMYGKNVEAALKLYHDTNDAYPESIDALTIESVGKTVACESSINYDGTVYLTNCKVDGVSVSDTNQEDGYYHYGRIKKGSYSIGDEVTYNGVDYYVIKDSGIDDSTLTMLKAEPLTVDEVNQYGVGHVNIRACKKDDSSCYKTAKDIEGYGGVAYYSGDQVGSYSGATRYCGYVEMRGDYYIKTDVCTIDYTSSDVKYIVDAWANSLDEENNIVEARLLTLDDLSDNLGYELIDNGSVKYWSSAEYVPDWIYNTDYKYWTKSPLTDSKHVLVINYDGSFTEAESYKSDIVLRPVITIKKSAL